MDNLAFCLDNIEITWSAAITVIGVIAAALLMLGLVPEGQLKRQVIFPLPFAIVFSIIAARFVHYYCNSEQYGSLKAALTDYSTGKFCFTGVVVGCAIALGLTKLLYRKSSFGLLASLYSLGLVLLLIVVRLSMLFGTDFRGKLEIKDERFCKLPYSTEVILEGTSIGYYLALFLLSAALLTVVLALSLWFWFAHAKRVNTPKEYGHSALFTLSAMSAAEAVTDSMRYDKSFFRSNGFISHAEIFYAAVIVAIFIFYNIRLVKKNGFRWYYILLWLSFLACVGGAGGLEYFVQRHGDLFIILYSFMFVFLCGMAGLNTVTYLVMSGKSVKKEVSKVVVADDGAKKDTPEDKTAEAKPQAEPNPNAPETKPQAEPNPNARETKPRNEQNANVRETNNKPDKGHGKNKKKKKK